jgi:hypothetical protein
MKTIVTHIGPDLDGIAAIWMIKTFIPGWEEASLAFVPAGKTMGNNPPDNDSEIMHVDTGFGKYDHHQTNDDICASSLIYQLVKDEHGEDPALVRLVAVVNDVDHFREAFFPNPTADYWEFLLVGVIDGWRLLYSDNPIKIVSLGMDCLDAIYKTFQNKIWAEKELKSGNIFETKWGKGVALETVNDEVVHLGQKSGYSIVIRKDPNKGYLRIKALPRDDIDLSNLYQSLTRLDPEATWFLHASRHMILNGSAKNPDMKPTTLTLEKIIQIIKEI